MTAIPNIGMRFEELTARLRIHLLKMHPAHELRHWHGHQETCPLVQAAFTYPVVGSLTLSDIRNYFRTRFLATLRSTSRLSALIDDSCRTDIGMDSVLEIPDSKIRSLAIAWRTNTFGLRATCTQCSSPFNRGHVNTCFTHSINGKLALSYERTKNLPLTFIRKYTILDHLLNVKRHDLFYREICLLQAFIASHAIITPWGHIRDWDNFPSSGMLSDG